MYNESLKSFKARINGSVCNTRNTTLMKKNFLPIAIFAVQPYRGKPLLTLILEREWRVTRCVTETQLWALGSRNGCIPLESGYYTATLRAFSK